jgi:hypothetical protein
MIVLGTFQVDCEPGLMNGSPDSKDSKYGCVRLVTGGGLAPTGKASEAIKEAGTGAKEPSHVPLSVGSEAHYESERVRAKGEKVDLLVTSRTPLAPCSCKAEQHIFDLDPCRQGPPPLLCLKSSCEMRTMRGTVRAQSCWLVISAERALVHLTMTYDINPGTTRVHQQDVFDSVVFPTSN